MENFKNISPSNNRKIENNKIPIKDQKGLTRRDVLSGLAATSALAFIGKPLINLISKETTDDSIIAMEDEQKLQEKLAEIARRIEPTQRQQDIERNDMDSIGKTFKQQIESSNTIILNKDTRNAIYKHWRHEYRAGSINHRDGIIAGLERMEPWIAEIKEIFNKYGISQEYIYLAIAESHFDMDAVSDKKAVGPYQIIPKTAHDYDLTLTSVYDERRDPIKSAELCAKHLQDGYANFGNDWQLALMNYNGGYTNQYIKHLIKEESLMKKEVIEKQTDADGNVVTFNLPEGKTLEYVANRFNTTVTRLKILNNIKNEEVRKLRPGKTLIIPVGREITFDNFNEWLENEINSEIAAEITERIYTVMTGDMLGTIAKAHNVDYREIKKINDLTSDNIVPGQRLKLPPIDSSKRIDAILELVSSYHENINYPGKFFAINDIIEQENLSQILETSTKNYKEMVVPTTKLATLQSYTIQRGNVFSDIIQAYKKRYPKYTALNPNIAELIKEQNNISNIGEIQAGQEIKLELLISKPPTLLNIAKQYDYDIDKLIELNPAIIDKNIPLSTNMLLRVPM